MIYTVKEAKEHFNDDLPRFMASRPTIISRKYGDVFVEQKDIDSANQEIGEKMLKPCRGA